MTLIHLLLATGAAYLIGSVSFAVIVSRVMGLADPRTYGSGNPGATNVLRSGSRWAAALTLLGDGFKGWVAVWLVLRFGPHSGVTDAGVALAAIAAVLGHMYPIFLRFRGGKGVATAAGVIIALNPWLALATAATWVIVAVFFRYASLASIAAAVFAPFYSAFGWGYDARFAALIVIAGLTIYRHRVNIRHLLAGTERRIGENGRSVQARK